MEQLSGYDQWLDQPYQDEMDARAEAEDDELDGLEEDMADDGFGDY